MKLTVRYFAVARERAKLGSEVVELPAGAKVADLKALLASRHPALASVFPQLKFALDEEFAPLDTPLHDGCEVALIPPVAGG